MTAERRVTFLWSRGFCCVARGMVDGPYPALLSIAVKKAMAKSNFWRQGFTWLTHPNHNLSQVKAGTQVE